MIRILGTIFAGLLGLCFGSFLNVCLSRWPEGESVVQPRSHCRHCDHTLAWWENFPLLSWLVLRGRCRSCKSWIGWRYPLVEFSVGVLWVFATFPFFENLFYCEASRIDVYFTFMDAIGRMIFYWILVALIVLDAEDLWLPNWITLPGSALGFLFLVAKAALLATDSSYYTLNTIIHTSMKAAFIGMIAILAAAGLILLIRWLYWLVRRREGMGLGDAKLMALLAAWLGLPGALLAFAVGVVLGALAGVVLLVFPSPQTKAEGWAAAKLPLGTFLCIGGIVSSLWGRPLIDAYLRWAGL